jgi:hypothetical protein
MTHTATDVKRLLCAVQRQLRTDLQQLAEEALQKPSCAQHKAVNGRSDVCDVDIERMRVQLALRTLASGYVLLGRLDQALDPPEKTHNPRPSHG